VYDDAMICSQGPGQTAHGFVGLAPPGLEGRRLGRRPTGGSHVAPPLLLWLLRAASAEEFWKAGD
jgi:hypothetical protein